MNRPGDTYEQEADRVADQVMRMTGAISVQRKCASWEENEGKLRRTVKGRGLMRTAGDGQATSTAPPLVSEVVNSGGGRPLDSSARAFFEPRFACDFGQVRVHTDVRAAAASQAVQARAFTLGHNIYFGAGEYHPTLSEGQRLLAHELAHVVQQAPGVTASSSRLGSPSDVHEQEANRAAWNLAAGSLASTWVKRPTEGAVGAMHLQRLIRTANVTCPAAVAGVANPNPYAADRRASALLDYAIARITTAQANRVANPTHADVVAVSDALRRVFHLNPADAATWTAVAPQVRLPVILRRLQMAKDYIDSVVFTVNCLPAAGAHVIPGCAAGTCTPGTEAFSCHVNSTGIDLCPPFWALNSNQRGRTWAHEVFHITFQTIDDWGQPNLRNAHCYAQFVALLNGFNAPAGFRCP